jgi:hypothetical protein
VTVSVDGPRTRRWRSRGFMQPLLLTIVGVTASAVFFEALLLQANGPSDGPCTYGPDGCGYSWMGAVGEAFTLLPVLVGSLLITGLVIGLSSHDPGLAIRAVVVGVILVPVVGLVVLEFPRLLAEGRVDAIVLNIAGAALIGLIALVPVALGFGVGRLVRPGPKDQSGQAGPE